MAVITYDFIKTKMKHYAAILEQRGDTSKMAADFRAKQVAIIRKYARNQADLDPNAIPVMEDYINTFADNKTKDIALAKFKEFVKNYNNMQTLEQAGPDTTENKIQIIIEKKRARSIYSDKNQEFIDNVSAAVFVDMGLISSEEYNAANGDTNKIFDLLCSVPELDAAKQQEFSERLTDRLIENEAWFNLLPPSVLARAYTGTKQRLENAGDADKEKLEKRLNIVQNRIDVLTDEFANKVGYYFADQTNVADVYDGYTEMFNVRKADVDDARKSVIEQNQNLLEESIKSYDDLWGLDKVDSERVDELDSRLETLTKVLNKKDISDDTISVAGKYKFLDEDGKPIPQFVDKKGNSIVNYSDGCILDQDGRLARVIDLARHDVVKKHVAKLDEKIDASALGQELEDELLFKLFEIDTADKVAQGALENPDQFTNPEHLNNFIADLKNNGGSISENGYQAAMDAQVNQTMGFAGRLKSKLQGNASKATGFFKKLFKPIEKIDKRAKTRFENSDKSTDRQKRIQFFVRMITGFANAFLTSAAITTIAVAAASLTGMGLATSIAVVGIVTSVGVSAYQIHKWRKAQQAEGKPNDFKELLKDKRMMASLGTSALAAIAMCFGVAGLREASMALGYGALAVGGANNTISTYHDAKQQGLSTTEALMWAFGNAVAVVAGGIAGRTVANNAINAFNAKNPENTLFQNKEVIQQEQNVTREETQVVYKDGVTEHAREIAESWYRNNPTELQNRVDMINQYNAEHGTNIDPYRAIVLNADAGGQTFDNNALHVDGGGVKYSGGQHTVMTQAWADANGVSMQEVDALRNLFQGGSLNEAGMNAALKLDGFVSANNEIGFVDGRPVHYDGVLPQNAVDANGNPIYTTYTGGESVFENQTVVVQDTVKVDVTEYQPVNIPYGVGMIGQYFRKGYSVLKDRIGALADKIIDKKKEIVEPVPPKPEPPVPPRPEPPVPPRPKPKPKPLPPYIEPEHEPVLRISRANAKVLLDSPEIIERIQKGRHGGVLSHRLAQHLKAKKKDAEQKLRTVKNECAWSADKSASDADLATAVEQVFLREELRGTEGVKTGKYAELEKLNQRRQYITNDKDMKVWQFEYDKLVAEIKDLESRLIPDKYFVDAQKFVPEYKRKSFNKGQTKLKKKIQQGKIIELNSEIENDM